MSDIAALVAGNLDIWTSATQRKSGAGRGGGKRISLYGIERLRALILDLAVRGRLVPQDSADEPAAEILKRVKSERNRLIAARKAKAGKPMPVPSEWPFAIPSCWAWTQLGHITNYGQTDKADPGSVAPETWVLELEDVEKGTSRLLERVRCADRPFQSQKNAFQAGDVIYGKLRPYLDKVIIADEAGVCTTEMVPMRAYGSILPNYIRLFLKTPYFIRLASNSAHGMNLPRLATEVARAAPFALPPLAEQRRIVAKVDELMALCDALERESADAMAAHQVLVEELLGLLVNSADATDLATNWARLETHFDTLFTTDTSIEALKQTILDLAVRGKLVEQDAGDETGGAFYKRIKEHKGLIQKSLRQRSEKFSQPLTDQSNNGEFPNGWFLTRFGEIMISRDAERVPISSEDRARRQGEYDYYGASGVIDKIDDFLFDKPLLLIGEDGANLINRSTPIAFIATGRYWVNNHAHVLDGISLGFLRYMELFINATDLKPYVTGTAQPKMNQAKMNSIEIALPPEAEQHRIVAKVDALMVLCDQLKTRLADAAQTQRHLADAITERAAA